MLDKPVDNKALLALYGIELKKECNSHAILRLKDKDAKGRYQWITLTKIKEI